MVFEQRGVKLSLLRRVLLVANTRNLPSRQGKKLLSWDVDAVASVVIGTQELELCNSMNNRWSVDTSTNGLDLITEENGSLLTCCNGFRGSLIDLLKTRYLDTVHPDLGVSYNETVGDKANLFVSFAYCNDFAGLINAIQTYLVDNGMDEDSTFLWLDPFVNDQWYHAENSFEWWSTIFKSAIADFGHTVAVLSPWNSPDFLTRAWCLFEFFCSVESSATGCKFGIAMSATDQLAFMNGLIRDENIILEPYKNIDVQKSTCRSPHDLEQIHNAVRRYPGGFPYINKIIFDALRTWMQDSVRKYLALEEARDNKSELTATLLSVAGDLSDSFGQYTRQKEHFERSLAINLDLFGNSDSSILYTKFRLAEANQNLGNYDVSEALFSECFAKFSELHGDLHSATTLSFSSLANLLIKRGNLDRVVSVYEEFMLKLASRPDAHRSESVTDVILNIYELKGEFHKAISLHEERLARRQRALGDDHVDTIAALFGLACCFFDLDDYERSEELFGECLAKRKQILGADHLDTLNSLIALGMCYIYRGKFSEAADIYHTWMVKQGKADVDSKKPSDLETMHGLHNASKEHLGRDQANRAVLHNNGQRSQTLMSIITIADRALHRFMADQPACKAQADHNTSDGSSGGKVDVINSSTDASSPHTVFSSAHIPISASIATPSESSPIKDGEEKIEDEDVEGEGVRGGGGDKEEQGVVKDKDTKDADDAISMARVYTLKGDFKKAQEIYERVYTSNRKKIGDLNPLTLDALYKLACCYVQLEDFEMALVLLRECIEKLSLVVGDNHPDTVSARLSFADCLVDASYDEDDVGEEEDDNEGDVGCQAAEAIYKEILAKYSPSTGDSHSIVIHSQYGLAVIYSIRGDFQAAIKLLEECLEKARQIYGPIHDQSLKILSELAQNYADCGDPARAIEMLERCCCDQRNLLGDSHPDYVYTCESLKKLYIRIGDYQKTGCVSKLADTNEDGDCYYDL